MSLKWRSEGKNGLNVSKLDSNMIRHSENDGEDISYLEERKLQIELSGMEERKLQIDEEGNRPNVIEEEDVYQLPDTQNHELHNSENHELHSTSSAHELGGIHSPIRSVSSAGVRLSDLHIPVHLHLDRQHHQEQLVGEPQLHVHEMSSTVSSPGRFLV